jgi:hypothetical protein
MVDLVITPGNVTWQSGTQPRQVKGGAALTRGKALRQGTDFEYIVADCSALNTATVDGIALTDGNDGGYMLIAPPGATINIGATTTAGTAYVLSDDGGICPVADLASGEFPNLLFWGTGTAVVTLVCALCPVAIPA